MVLGVASVIVVVVVATGLGALGNGPGAGSSQTTYSTTSASYDVGAASVLVSAASLVPAGYVQGSVKTLSPKEFGLTTAAYSVFTEQGGPLANVTVIVFNSSSTAEAYSSSVIANAKALPGYVDVTSTLAAYQHYGACYGYAESDPEGGQYVANGICQRGNVYIQVHVASGSSLSSAETDAATFVGAAYDAVGSAVL